MPVAAPMISRIAPDSAAVSISIGRAAASRNCAVDQQARQHRIDDADGRDLGRGRDALDHRGGSRTAARARAGR
jgi:hypothetical protein